MFCKKCGQEMEENQNVCPNCGEAQETAVKPAGEYLAGKDKMTIILVCLFLGGLGIHNFMMGENKKGILKLVLSLCTGLGGILALIDLIKIAMDKYEVDAEKFI